MKRNLLYLCMVSLLLVGCWKENDGEKDYEDKPQRAASATMERAMGLLSHLMLMTKEKGDTLLANQKITLIDYDSFLGQMEYEITADDLHIMMHKGEASVTRVSRVQALCALSRSIPSL